jgi:hypothetical protein
LSFRGEADDQQLVAAVIQSVYGIVANFGLNAAFLAQLSPWIEKYQKEIKYFGLKLAR